MGPLTFKPLLKRSRWGGRRLGDVLGKPIGPESDFAESWEVCDHGADQSLVATGDYAGWTLRKLIAERPAELLGKDAGQSRFPLLIKFLDARDRLSLQVHPNDAQADRVVRGERGKTEAWVILLAEPGSYVFAGLKSGVTAAVLQQALEQGTVEAHLHRVLVTPGDCLFIPAGTVHAIGEGILLAEVQQSSDATFRLFDWNRVGADGKPRELHIERALSCIDFERGPVNKADPTKFDVDGQAAEILVSCTDFTICRHTIERRLTFSDDNRCRIIIALEGIADCIAGGERQSIRAGDTVLIPAAGLPATVDPKSRAVLLEVFW